MNKTVYQMDSEGILIRSVTLDDSDLCPITKKFLIPGGCTELEPPEFDSTKQFCKLVNNAWTLIDIPVENQVEQTLDELKEQAWDRVKAIRDEQEQLGVTYLDKKLDSDRISVVRIAIAVQAALAAKTAGTEFSLVWTMQDNSSVTMTVDQVIGMATALANHSNAIHQTARNAYKNIYNATSAEEINTIESSIIWPA